MKFCSFHYYKSFYYILLSTFIQILADLFNNISPVQDNTFLNHIYSSLGQSFSIILYIIEKKYLTLKEDFKNQRNFINKQLDEVKRENSMNKSKNIFVFKIICFISILSFIYSYSNYFLKIDNNFIECIINYETIIFNCCLFINEHYFLNIQNYIHHYSGIFLCLINCFYQFLYYFLSIINERKFLNLFCLFIIYFELGFLDSITPIIEKKLNFEYYISIYYICFLEGIISLFWLLLNYVFSIIFLKNDVIFFGNQEFNITFIIHIILNCLFEFILKICKLKILEINRPSYNSIADFFSLLISNLNFELYYEPGFNIITQCFPYFLSSLGSLIFCEVITLNFCNLNENTFFKTRERAKNENLSLYSIISFENEK